MPLMYIERYYYLVNPRQVDVKNRPFSAISYYYIKLNKNIVETYYIYRPLEKVLSTHLIITLLKKHRKIGMQNVNLLPVIMDSLIKIHKGSCLYSCPRRITM